MTLGSSPAARSTASRAGEADARTIAVTPPDPTGRPDQRPGPAVARAAPRVRCRRDGDDHAGPRRAGGVPGRARPDGHVGHLRPGRRPGEHRHDPRRPRRRDHAARHRRLLRHGPQRAAAPRRAARDPPGQRVHPGEVRRPAGPVRRVHRARRQPGRGEELAGLHADPARHRLRRPVPARPARPAGADRGHGRGDRRDGPGRVRPLHRPVRDGGGDHPPGARRAPDRRPADRVLADEPGHRGARSCPPCGSSASA